ncbi:uncharacterized protein LOC107828887 [Nicotiana tabacum]|uniref:Uncharacterized protein LOC107828887 n=1 Tax=Nicotiana tabacum TaxID=4097 RepID=A0A1S4DEJ3_TOBAC|nr:PREDICTED: uncharacterized protein LOC107828887 [Nicotiana tabacum]
MHIRQKTPIKIGWHKPPKGWFKLNIDASFGSGTQKYGLGGVFWNVNGHWIVGFGKLSYVSRSLEAEIKALLEGFKTAQEWGMRPLVIETDSVEVVNAPAEGDDPLVHIQARK